MQRKMMENLIKWRDSNQRKPLLLKGVRQVGKTYLLKEFGKTHFGHCHYFNFEKQPDLAAIFEQDFDPKRILSALSFYANAPIKAGEDLVIFDEIQEAPRALTSLKYFAEDLQQLHLCAAGSLLGLHLGAASFPVGKVTFETLRPLSFEEFLLATNDKALPFLQNLPSNGAIPEIVHIHLWEALKHYFVVGGLPEVVATYCEKRENLFDAFSEVRKKQSDLINSYYADIAKHAGKVNAMHIERLLLSVPSQLSLSQDGSTNRFKFKGVVPGISHYDRLAGAIDWLEAAGLVVKVKIASTGALPLGGHTKENFFKLLLFDVGLLGSMSALPPKTLLDADYGSYKGYFAENFVAQELLAAGHEPLTCWQEGKSEIEFLVEQEGAIIPLEVKSGKVTKAASLKIFAQKYNPPYQLIFSAKPLKINHSIRYCPLYLTGLFSIRKR